MSVFQKHMLIACVVSVVGCDGSEEAPLPEVKQVVVNTCEHDYVAYRDGDGLWLSLGANEKNQEHILTIKESTYSVAMINGYSNFVDVTVANFNRDDEFRFDACGVIPDIDKAILPAGWKNVSISAGGGNGEVYDLLAKASNAADEEYYLLHQNLSIQELESQVSDFGDTVNLHKAGASFNSGVVKLKERFPNLNHYSITYASKNGAMVSLHEDDKGKNRGIPDSLRHAGDSFSHSWSFRDEGNKESYSYSVVSMGNSEELNLNHRPKTPLPAKREVENGRATVHLSPYYLDTLQKDTEFYSVGNEKVYGSEGKWETIYWRVVASKGYLFASGRQAGKITIPEPGDFPNLKINIRSVSEKAEFGSDVLSVDYSAYSPSREDWGLGRIGSIASSISVLTD